VFDTADRLDRVERMLGGEFLCGTNMCSMDVHERLDRIEERLAGIYDWKRRVEERIGVIEVTVPNGRQVFLGSKVEPLFGYINIPEEDNE
jgi:hypothetical protein